jgi:hypothetical protein
MNNKTENKQEALDVWCSDAGIQFKDEKAAGAYRERTARIADAVRLKVPDRVPISPAFSMFPALDSGYTCEEVIFDYNKAHNAWVKAVFEYEPDMFIGSGTVLPGPVLEILDYKPVRLPGRDGASPHHVHTIVKEDFFEVEEFYDEFLDDPSDFMLRKFLPQVCGTLEPLQKIRPLYESYSQFSMLSNLIPLGTPEIAGALDSLARASNEALKWAMQAGQEAKELMSMGFPNGFAGLTHAPYDIIGNWFRGSQGVMLDMYRHPDKLKAVMEKLVPKLIRSGVYKSRRLQVPFTAIMLHFGAEGFMSVDQFKTFYWPYLKTMITGIIEQGMLPVVFFEGDYTSRLEIIADIPRAKAIYWFEKVDIRKAKEILGDTVCIRGNVPITLLCMGTPEEVKQYVKELIDVVGKDGGLIVDSSASIDEGKHENVKAMVDFTKEYGVYR